MRKILEIEEIGYPLSLILTEGSPISELISTKKLVRYLHEEYLKKYDTEN